MMKSYYLYFFSLLVFLNTTSDIKAQLSLCPSSEGRNFCEDLDGLIKSTEEAITYHDRKQEVSNALAYKDSRERLVTLRTLISNITNDNYETILEYSETSLTNVENGKVGKEILGKITAFVNEKFSKDTIKETKMDTAKDDTSILEIVALTKKIKSLEKENSRNDRTIEEQRAEIERIKSTGTDKKWKNWLILLGFPFLLIFFFLKDKIFKKRNKKEKSSSSQSSTEEHTETIRFQEVVIRQRKTEIEKLKTTVKEASKENEKLQKQNAELEKRITELSNTRSFKESPFEEVTDKPSPEITLSVANQSLIPKETFYIQDKESDNRFKMTKASKQEEAWSRFRLEQVDVDLYNLYVIERQEYIDILVSDKIRLLEPFFEIVASGDISKNIIKTLIPAQLKKDSTNKYWVLENLGKLEFNRA